MYPTTDQGRIEHLHLILSEMRLARRRGESISCETYLRFMGSYGAMVGHQQLVGCAEHRFARCRAPYMSALDFLIRTSRDFWHGLQRQARRLGTPERLQLYCEPGCNPLPLGSKASYWIGFAQRLIDGERLALAAGYRPQLQPSLSELSQALQRVEALQPPYLVATDQRREARRGLASARAVVDRSLRYLAKMLRLTCRNRVSARQALRRYGYQLPAVASPPPPVEQLPIRTRAANLFSNFHLLPFALAGLQSQDDRREPRTDDTVYPTTSVVGEGGVRPDLRARSP